MATEQGVVGAWLVGTGIIVYRVIAREHRPPVPGELLASSGLFVLLALLAIPAPSLAVTIAVGVDIAAFMNVAGSGQLGQALSGPTWTGTVGRGTDFSTGTDSGAPTLGGGVGQGLGGPVGAPGLGGAVGSG